MLTIRLQRTGTKNKSSFRIVLAESYRSASKQALEVLGNYNPRQKTFAIKDQERLKYWLGKHVSLSPTIHNLFVDKKLVDSKKVKAWAPKKKAGAEGEKPTEAPVAQATTPSEAPATEAVAEVEAKS